MGGKSLLLCKMETPLSLDNICRILPSFFRSKKIEKNLTDKPKGSF